MTHDLFRIIVVVVVLMVLGYFAQRLPPPFPIVAYVVLFLIACAVLLPMIGIPV